MYIMAESGTYKQIMIDRFGGPPFQMKPYIYGEAYQFTVLATFMSTWRFPEMGVPLNHPFQWDFPL